LRLVTFDRRGHRRLGAFLWGEVVDLPDAVGHPAFPTTMEALVARNGGTVLDAARAALERHEVEACVVPNPRLLIPLLPASYRSDDATEASRRIAGPDSQIPWPAGAGWLDYVPKVAAVLRRMVPQGDAEAAETSVFGYTLVNDWAVRDATGDPTAYAEPLPFAMGPCIVTPDEIDPQTLTLSVRVDGEEWATGHLNGTAGSLLSTVVAASRLDDLSAGETFASSAFDVHRHEQRVWPGATIELEAERIGVLRNRVGRPA
jgi:2-keto-4-pentenoate hydratase/2-oxohepta-3-ene-1,7-dioic acid hydratase in catechol pathway